MQNAQPFFLVLIDADADDYIVSPLSSLLYRQLFQWLGSRL